MPQKIKINEEEFLIQNNGKGDFVGSGSFLIKAQVLRGNQWVKIFSNFTRGFIVLFKGHRNIFSEESNRIYRRKHRSRK